MTKVELVHTPKGATAEETWAAAENIMQVLARGHLRESLNIIRYNGLHIKRNIRSITIKEHYHALADKSYSYAPEIILRGKWLQQVGFEPKEKIWALPFAETLIIIPQGESRCKK